MPGRVIRQQYIRRADLKANRTTFYVFGDNMEGKGLGGQARECRGEPNAVGIPTKWRPDMRPTSFFTDADYTDRAVWHAITDCFTRLEELILLGHDVVIPADGVGTGLAELPKRAPKIYAFIQNGIAGLEALATT